MDMKRRLSTTWGAGGWGGAGERVGEDRFRSVLARA